jgi:hypothetical protein
MWEFLELLLELVASAVDLGEIWRFFLCFAGAAIAAGLIDAFYPDRAFPTCAIVLFLGCTFGGVWEIGSRL